MRRFIYFFYLFIYFMVDVFGEKKGFMGVGENEEEEEEENQW